ncbi:Protein of unknown function [Escherichia coli D6-113.11]|nr:Protein of unknown function [Escherichia coli D6-113.11]CDU34088.1 Protein of unknown function [Escherichia coli D6-113.11]
MAVYIS